MTLTRIISFIPILAALGISSTTSLAASGSAFTYQGRLTDGTNLGNQPYNMTFKLFDSSTAGSQVGSTITTNGVPVTNGLFTVTLDFGSSAFPGANRWLEIAVAVPPATPTTLSPRQFIAAAPYAISASNLSGTLPAAQLTGTLQSSQLAGTYSGSVNLNNPANIFIGNGSGLLGVDAITLGGYGYCNLPCYWKLTGNSGTTPGVNFVGTTDNQALELKVFGERALRLEPNSTSPNVIEGYKSNWVGAGVFGAAIGGGGSASAENSVSGNYSTIGGGQNNDILTNVAWSVIGGGLNNRIDNGVPPVSFGVYGTIGGGSANALYSSDLTPAIGSTISGGESNSIGSSYDSVIAGGVGNTIRSHDDVGSATIGGGAYNSIANSSGGVTIAGGVGNSTVAASYVTISGGQSNFVYALATGATIAGGTANQIPQFDPPTPYATISGGQANMNNRAYGTIGGGLTNIINSAYGVIGGGAINRIDREPFGPSTQDGANSQRLAAALGT